MGGGDEFPRGSSELPRIDDSLIGAVLEGKYRVTRLLGAGAMGAVYRAKHVALDREVAVKVLHQDLLVSKRAKERFEAEARIAGRLRHENLVGVIDMVELDDGSLAMVCEYAVGMTLSALLTREVRLAPVRALELARGICRGLGTAHAAGLVHRDLKPDNVIVEELSDGRLRPRIIDFGIALARDEQRHTEIGLVVGTPTYMAPEQALGQPVSSRTDLFSLGIIAYELIAGKTPFGLEGVDAALANVTRDLPPFAERVPGLAIDPVLEAIVVKLAAKREQERFATAAEVIEMLDLLEYDRELAGSLLGVDGGIRLRPVPPLRERVAALKEPERTQPIPRLPTEEPDGIAITRARTRRTRAASEPIGKLDPQTGGRGGNSGDNGDK